MAKPIRRSYGIDTSNHPRRKVAYTGPLSQQDAYRAPYHDELEAAARAGMETQWPEYLGDYDDVGDYDGGDE